MTERGLTKQEIYALLAKSPHGSLEEYGSVGPRACEQDPEFFAHLIAWNAKKGSIRDSKLALPMIALAHSRDEEFLSNAKAHLAQLPLRDFLRGARSPLGSKMRHLAVKVVRNMESHRGHWNRVAVQHRAALKELYALMHIKPADFASKILFDRKYPAHSIFAVIAGLRNMDAAEAAGTVMKHKIPFLIASGALGEKIKDEKVLLALIKSMSAAEVGNNMTRLERLGVNNNPALKAAVEEALGRVRKGSSSALKLSKAAGAVKDKGLKAKVLATQEAQLSAQAVKGNWLVLCDVSQSMEGAIPVAREVAAVLARAADGKVHLVFFNESPRYIDATGKTLDEIEQITRHVRAGGMTSVGCGLQYAIENNLDIDGVVIISDAQENTAPYFMLAHQSYEKKFGKSLPVYLYGVGSHYHVHGVHGLRGQDSQESIDITVFDLSRQNIDYYALPNLVLTMRTNRYSLVDEIMASKLLKLEDVLKNGKRS